MFGIRRRALLAAAVLAASVVAASPASAEGGTIVGRITDALGLPLRGICVEAFTTVDHSPSNYQTRTDDLGIYKLQVAPGRYWMTFGGYYDGCDSPYATEYLGDTYDSLGQRLTVRDGEIATANAAMERWGRVTGRVTWTRTGKPIPNVCVVPYRGPGGFGSSYQTDVSDAQGRYELDRVAPGDTQVVFGWGSCSYTSGKVEYDAPPTVYSKSGDRRAATTFAVAPGGSVSGIDQALPRGGIVSGRVVDRRGKPVRDMYVFLHAQDGTDSDAFTANASAVTDHEGRYVARGLVTARYVVEFDVRGNWHRYYPNLSSRFADVPELKFQVERSYRLSTQTVNR